MPAATRPPVPPPEIPDNEVLMEEMALYAEKINLEGMMQEYLRRVLLNKPEDPIVFLTKQIRKEPLDNTPPARPKNLLVGKTSEILAEQEVPVHIKEKDPRSEEEKSKHMDRKTASERATLLKELFEVVEPVPGTQVVSKAKLIVALNARPDILLERFPHHVQDILRCIARIKTESDEGMTLAEFSENAGRILRAPGGLATP